MLKNSQIRKRALETLDGNWGSAAVITLVYFVLQIIANTGGNVYFGSYGTPLSLFGGVMSVLLFPVAYGFAVAFLGFVRGGQLEVKSLFRYYTSGRVWAVMLLTTIYFFLWALLLIIPGIIKSYSYSMAPFIMKDNPEMNADRAIDASMKMMKGHKMRLFLLDLSFIGWMLLAILTLGVGFLLLEPYMVSARAVFYEELKAEQDIDGADAGYAA